MTLGTCERPASFSRRLKRLGGTALLVTLLAAGCRLESTAGTITWAQAGTGRASFSVTTMTLSKEATAQLMYLHAQVYGRNGTTTLDFLCDTARERGIVLDFLNYYGAGYAPGQAAKNACKQQLVGDAPHTLKKALESAGVNDGKCLYFSLAQQRTGRAHAWGMGSGSACRGGPGFVE